MRRVVEGVGFALVIAGCNAPAGAPVEAAPIEAGAPEATVKTEVTPVTPVTPVNPATPATVPTPTAEVPTPTPVAATDGPGAPSDSRLQVAVTRDGDLQLHLLDDAVFVSGAGGLAQLDARGERMVNVEYGLSGQADPGPAFDEWTVLDLGGRWPDNAWLSTLASASRSSTPPLLHRREGDVWKRQATKQGILQRAYARVLAWHSGQVLGWRTYDVDPALYEYVLDISPAMQRRIDRAMAQVKPGFDVLGPKPTPASMVIAPGLVGDAVAAAPTGELFMLAHVGKDEPRVQRWGLAGDAAVAGTVDTLPGLSEGTRCVLLAVRAADEAYVGCGVSRQWRMILLRFDGAAWSQIPGPKDTSIDALSVSPDGDLYAVLASQSELWRRPAGGAWEQMTLPELRFADRATPEWTFDPMREVHTLQPADPAAAGQAWTLYPVQVLARPGGEVWVAARTQMVREGVSTYETIRRVVLRAGPIREPLRMLPDGDMLLEWRDWRPAPAWQPGGCDEELPTQDAFVAVHTLPRDAPHDQPEPLLEAFVRDNAALMGQVERIVEVYRRGRRTLGLFVKPTDQAQADALVAAIDRAAPGEKHTIECRTPRIRRVFDKTTGKAVQAPAP